MLRSSFLSVPALIALVAMLGGCDGGSTPSGRGFTACGDVTCQPGQYCDDPRFSACSEGCLSDVNCSEGQACDTAAFFPTCVNTATPADASMPPDQLARCRAACEHFQSCGLPAAEAAQCLTDCAGLSSEQQRVVGNCGEEACASVPACLGIDCLSSADCSGAAECIGGSCL